MKPLKPLEPLKINANMDQMKLDQLRKASESWAEQLRARGEVVTQEAIEERAMGAYLLFMGWVANEEGTTD